MKTNIPYSNKLKDPRWQKIRLQVFERDQWTCQSCGSTTQNLQVHHLKYISGAEPWDYELHYLITYCEICHETDHLIGDKIEASLMELIKADAIYIKPLAQLCILIEKDPAFFLKLRQFLNDCQIAYLQSKTLPKTA